MEALPSTFASGKWSRLPKVLELISRVAFSLKRKTTDKDYSRFGEGESKYSCRHIERPRRFTKDNGQAWNPTERSGREYIH